MKRIKLLVCLSVIGISICNAQSSDTKIEIDYSKSKNILSLNYADLLFSRIAISYERLLLNGKLGLKTPVAISLLNKEQKFYSNQSILRGGLDFNYYPMGQKRFTFFTGLSTKVEKSSTQNYEYCPTCNILHTADVAYSDYLYYSPIPSLFFSTYVNNGLQFTCNKNFSISGQFGIGVRKDLKNKNSYYYYNRIESSLTGELNLSFRL